MTGEHAQPVIEVGAEAAALDFLAQVTVGGGDDARLTLPALRFAHALVLAVLQYAQQLRLQLERQLADLVQKQAAVAGVLEVAGARGARSGEGTFGVAEQRGFDQDWARSRRS